eukprot:SAG31_NODE_21021_length_567_cov_1.282609_1_plen_68_part_00
MPAGAPAAAAAQPQARCAGAALPRPGSMPSQTNLVAAARWDLLIHSGRVIDPASGLDGEEYDVAVLG